MTTTPNSEDISIMSSLDDMCRNYEEHHDQDLRKLRTAVAALVARNAELEAERDAWKLAAWHARDERDAKTERAAFLIAQRDALIEERDALRVRLANIADHCRDVYGIVPMLPIDETSISGATEALTAFCMMIGIERIDIGLAPTQDKTND